MLPHIELHKSSESLKPEVETFDYYLQRIKEETNTPIKGQRDHDEYVKTCYMSATQCNKTDLSEGSYSDRQSANAHIYKERDHQLLTTEMIPETLFPNFNLLVGNRNSFDINTMTPKYHENKENNSEVGDDSTYKKCDITSSSQSEYDSDIDSIMSSGTLDVEDPPNYSSDCLKNAGVYTLEEVLRITSSKLMRLKYLYKKQLGILEYHLREGYRKYLSQKKREKEMWGSQLFPKLVKQEYQYFEISKATTRYHQHSGLAKEMRRLHEHRTEAGMAIRKQRFRKCMFTEGGVRCTEQVLPLAKYCIKHILFDSKQILFQACGSVSGEVECKIPVLTIFQNTACVYHTDLKQYSPNKKVNETVVDANKISDNEPIPLQTRKV